MKRYVDIVVGKETSVSKMRRKECQSSKMKIWERKVEVRGLKAELAAIVR